MSANLRAALGTLLDQYDATRHAAQARDDQAAADGALFLAQFAELRRAVVRPVFESAGSLLRERGHDFSIEEHEFAAQADGKSTEAAIALRVAPAGMEKAAPADDDFRALSFTTRHYNKTISVRNGAVPYEGAGAKAAYAPARITTQLVEEEVLKLVAALVKS
jgi:hypothetical protein